MLHGAFHVEARTQFLRTIDKIASNMHRVPPEHRHWVNHLALLRSAVLDPGYVIPAEIALIVLKLEMHIDTPEDPRMRGIAPVQRACKSEP